MQFTFEEFKATFNKYYRFTRLSNYVVCVFMLVLGVFLSLNLKQDFNSVTTEVVVMYLLILLFFFGIGIWGLIILKRKYKLTYWENTLTKAQNEKLIHLVKMKLTDSGFDEVGDFQKFTIWRGWYKVSWQAFFFADDNYIVFNIESLKGLIDFGADQRRKTMILGMLEENLMNIE